MTNSANTVPTTKITIAGVELTTRHVSCGLHTEGKTALAPVLNKTMGLVVYLTNACNATCAFCSNTDAKAFRFDFEAFKVMWDELISKADVSQVAFTGGEPTLALKDFYKCADYIKATRPTPLVVMTNGVKLAELDHELLTQISVSRHHWNHADNERILGFKLKEDYLSVPAHNKIKIACNVMKGEVDSGEKMLKVLDLAATYDIPTVGFVGLMQINDFTAINTIQIPEMTGKGLYNFEKWKLGNACECARSLYSHPSGKLIKYYYRHNHEYDYNHGGLVVFKYNKVQPWFVVKK